MIGVASPRCLQDTRGVNEHDLPEACVAAVQVESKNGALEQNLHNAEPHVAVAASQGAKLVVCPEFMATGYIYAESIWSCAERRDGPTEAWLRKLARHHEVYLGAGYLETDGADFFNTYTIADPSGQVAGRVRKGSLPVFEGWYFRPSRGSKVIETELGRVGVGICNDNQTCWFLDEMERERPDLLIMPHSAPVPDPSGLPVVGNFFARLLRERAPGIAAQYARALGVPVVFCNKTLGATRSPVPGLPWLRIPWQFEGGSHICDAEGLELATMGHQQGVAVAKVQPGARCAAGSREARHFYWSFEPPELAHTLGGLMLALEALGKASYAKNPRRPRAAARS